MKEPKPVVAVDFDGTCVTHDYPRVGYDIGAAPILRKLAESGNLLMLWTMRGSGKELDDAIEWFKTNNIPLWGINNNPAQKASGWSISNKQHALLYIDDAALGAPLAMNPDLSNRPFIHWPTAQERLIQMGLIKTKTNE
jgi:hypothetical protein